jgi:hypothetical protein
MNEIQRRRAEHDGAFDGESEEPKDGEAAKVEKTTGGAAEADAKGKSKSAKK